MFTIAYKTILLYILFVPSLMAYSQADPTVYLANLKNQLTVKWPHNRTINLVFHGHSVPTGYFNTPNVQTLAAYPHQLLERVKEIYPYAVVNAITTSIGGENAEQGAKRFTKDVLVHKPDVLFIDYALNDRKIGLARARKATERMIKKAIRKGIKVILLTPSPDLATNWDQPDNELAAHRAQLIELATTYGIGMADTYGVFKNMAENGIDIKGYMAQSNHPNGKGHHVIVQELLDFFE